MLEMAPVGDDLYRRGYAGDTFNTVWHMAQLLGGNATAGFVTRVGRDRLSDGFAAEMSADGLDVSGVARDPVRTMGLYLIELDGVERSFQYWRQVSAARLLADDPSVLAAALHGAGLIQLSGITLAILSPDGRNTLFRELAEARRAGAVIAFDPNIRPRLWSSPEEIRETVSKMLSFTDIALPSFDDEAEQWGDLSSADTIARFVACGVREVVVKNGAGNVRFFCDGRVGSCDTPFVDEIRDTTGAGDAFNAGYLSARMMGHPPKQAVSVGQKLSALVIQHFGGRAPSESVKHLSHLVVGSSRS
jgi:2-dehydro-3-deoxygluconokinase